jgi:hypothetical protein
MKVSRGVPSTPTRWQPTYGQVIAMTEDNVATSFKCKNCSAPITFPDEKTDATIIKCGKCGTEIGPYRDFKAIARDSARKVARESFGKAFKRSR